MAGQARPICSRPNGFRDNSSAGSYHNPASIRRMFHLSWIKQAKKDGILLERKTVVSLNVKDPEAHRLAQSIAQATGETITHAVITAL
ncbi:MAG: type II toxin-antitoxin system VapB family antitoxin [Bryobacterales bacterium]|nr:type II toxin-antitoxin system VapB family antitoxin [Bryobacterales bacterium]